MFAKAVEAGPVHAFENAVTVAPFPVQLWNGTTCELAMNELGERIRAKRKDKDMSQRELAEIVGVGFPHLSKIENGAETPSDELLVKIATALDDDVDSLMTIARRVTPDLVEIIIDSDVTRTFLRKVRNGEIPMDELEKRLSKLDRSKRRET